MDETNRCACSSDRSKVRSSTTSSSAIADVEGARPESRSIATLIEGRDWLFENNAQHTDSSHIGPVLAMSAELDDKETLKLAAKLPTTEAVSVPCSSTRTILRSRMSIKIEVSI